MKAVYKITNTITGNCYIGSTSNYRKRLQKWRDWKNSCSNKRICDDFRKYGFDAFRFEVLIVLPDETTKEERERIEYRIIHETNPYYNTIGKPRPEETKRKIASALSGRKTPEDVIARVSAVLKKRYREIPRDGSCTFKPVYLVENGMEFESVKSAAQHLGCDPSSVSRAINYSNRTVKGFHVRTSECRD